MDEGLKKDIWKVFSVASFLFITIFFILPYLIQISTYFHEKSHQNALEKYGVNSYYEVNLLETIPNFFNPTVNKLGVTKFSLEEYNKLDKMKRADINLAGIISDLRFLFLIGIYLAMANVYIFYKVRFKEDYDLSWSLGTNWILFMWLLALVQITVSNLTFQLGDFWQLIKGLGI
ncbi:MAG: hypothetical protein Q8N99_06095 [Nanoarchaeota archaeon]|nr:hypothetical protein [Nanoarchaeota archaeon]